MLNQDETTRLYTAPDRRRAAGPALPQPSDAQITVMIENEVERRLSKLEERLTQHIDTKFDQLHDLISAAFPDGDPHGHRAFHDSQIKQADVRAKIRVEVLTKFMTSGLWVAAGWLAYTAWQAFKDGLKP